MKHCCLNTFALVRVPQNSSKNALRSYVSLPLCVKKIRIAINTLLNPFSILLNSKKNLTQYIFPTILSLSFEVSNKGWIIECRLDRLMKKLLLKCLCYLDFAFTKLYECSINSFSCLLLSVPSIVIVFQCFLFI